MSTSESKEEGFSLVEMVVAMSLLAVVLVASLPMFLSALRSTVVTKQQTQAKNLSQERLEQIRNLRFHVAAQNGPYLDLLDVYYSDALVAARPGVTVGSDVLTGAFVAAGGGTDLEPAAPYYRVGIASLAGAPGFSQVVTAQFLEADGRTVLPAARFEGTYNSQTAGVDSPPTLTLSVSVITSWTRAGQQKRFRTSTLVTDARPQAAVIQSQARAVAVEVSSTASDATNLVLQGGVASLDGAQSSGSSVSGYATGAVARRTGQTVVEGLNAHFQLPVSSVVTDGSGSAFTPAGCAWAGFGRSAVDNVTGDVASGLPKAPANVDGTSPNVITGRLDDNASNSCGVLGFTNVVDAGVPRADAVGMLTGGSPLVRVADGGGSGTAVSGSAYVTATTLLVSPQRTRSGVRATMARPVVLFPDTPDNPGGGLVTARLTTASADCTSGTSTTNGTVAAAYSLSLRWWGKVGAAPATWHQAVYAYDSSLNSAPVLQPGSEVWAPSATFLSNGQPLSALVTGGPPVGASTGGQSGQRGFPAGILTLTTASTLGNESQPGYSAVTVRLGQLTCIADDQR